MARTTSVAAVSRNSAAEPRQNTAKEGADETAARSPYTVEVLNKAFDILRVFRPESPFLTLKQIVSLTGLPKTTTFRILATLVDRQFCEYDPESEQYSLGFAFLRFGDIR